jgi:hypothetical protein
MVLLQIHAPSPWRLPFKGDRPWPVDVNAMANRISVEFMQLESGHIEILESVGRVKRVENVYAALPQPGIDSGAAARVEQLLQAFVPEARDHDPTPANVTR